VRELRPLVVTLLGVTTVVLGTIGFHRLHDKHYDVIDSMYRAVTLFGLAGNVDPPVPLALQVARILGPLLTGYAAIKGLLAISREQVQLLGIRMFIRDHVVVAGLGTTGQRLAAAFHEAGFRVVAIEKNAAAETIPGARERGISVVRGDATDPAILRHARVGQARHLIVSCGLDGTNVDVSGAAGRLVTSHRRGVLTALVHLEDLTLWQALRAEAVAAATRVPFRLEFFNIAATGARLLLERHPAFEPPGEQPRRPHVVVVGLDGVGEELVLALVGTWHATGVGPSEELRITIAGPAADALVAELRERHPELDELCALDGRPAALESAMFRRGRVMLEPDGSCDVSHAYVSLNEESAALAAALALHADPAARAVPVVVAVADEDAGVAMALAAEGGSFAAIEPFGVLSGALSPILLLRGTNEILARAKHNDYLREERALGSTPADNPSLRPWEELPESLKESNRRFADGIGPKLEAAGCALVPAPLGRADEDGFAFSAEEVETLARAEHERWAEDLRRDGWRPTAGEKDPGRRLHPLLVSWEQLPEVERDKDREPVRDLPRMLARAGFRLYRTPGRS
jgi:TrkA-N domain/RyR domain